KAPGRYPLTKSALQFLDGEPHALIDLLELGLGKPMPPQTKALILKQPSIRIASGIVLEFSSPAQLKQLRRQPVFRKYIDAFLSPQRVLVSNDMADSFFRMLKRRGAFVDRNEEQVELRRKRTHFLRSKQKTMLELLGRQVPLLTLLEKYRDLQQALDIQYRMPGYPAEPRRITPLSIEERGGKTYVVAWCQTRRAQRTFRLDRMQVPGVRSLVT
ncbi:MAG TPA: WYL domain-containing protein, partial [Anaerolineales bacterium]|nr:WYL domain-containing protein [Anaerolineales bacterium]